ncbi:MAG TPA: exodeoxyribonuclease VII large subunit, partial [Ignavibacteriaceae bacterium]|nr:exodeoxyribonuclease VII large subunit [Ignavibacteriaceae bacterium]
PAKVQGAGAAESIVSSIKLLNQQKDIGIIIVGRGGGSIEDLWAFNEEEVARAIFASKIPVISAVGHEVDFTIADFVADLRAATPTAAMELSTPNAFELIEGLQSFIYDKYDLVEDKIHSAKNDVQGIINSYGLRMPMENLRRRSQNIDGLIYRIENQFHKNYNELKSRLKIAESKIQSNSVEKTLKKGFVLVKQQNKFVQSSEKFVGDMPFNLKFHDKEIEVTH